MRPIKISVVMLSVVLSAVGCSMPSKYVVTPIPSITPVQAQTATPGVIENPPTPTATIGAFEPFTIRLLDAPVNLRVNPGLLFPVQRLLPAQAEVTVLGKAPGDEWLYVESDDGTEGWVATVLAVEPPNLAGVPSVIPEGINIIKGVLKDAQSQPISGVGFAAEPGGLGTGTQSANGTTDASGVFYIYLPLDAGQTWTVTYSSVACTSNTMDANCNCLNNACGRPDPERLSVTLPGDSQLTFTWKLP